MRTFIIEYNILANVKFSRCSEKLFFVAPSYILANVLRELKRTRRAKLKDREVSLWKIVNLLTGATSFEENSYNNPLGVILTSNASSLI